MDSDLYDFDDWEFEIVYPEEDGPPVAWVIALASAVGVAFWAVVIYLVRKYVL